MQEINHALTTIEQESFLVQTSIASSHSLVKRILTRTKEVSTLVEQRERSLPEMHARYRSSQHPLPDHACLVYFLIFGLMRDRAMVPDLLAYLKESLALPAGTWQFPWHPFFYGASALMEILDNASPFDFSVIAAHPDVFVTRMEVLSMQQS